MVKISRRLLRALKVILQLNVVVLSLYALGCSSSGQITNLNPTNPLPTDYSVQIAQVPASLQNFRSPSGYTVNSSLSTWTASLSEVQIKGGYQVFSSSQGALNSSGN